MAVDGNTMNLMEAKNISVKAEQQSLLREISFTLKAGEILAIIGPNGAGKSTLFKALLGDMPIACGVMAVRDATGAMRPTYSPQYHAKAVAVLPQASRLDFPYTVEEVVTLGRLPHSSGGQSDVQIVRQAMKALDIHHLADSVYTTLSGGEKQRTQLARVMAQIWRKDDAASRVLLLDEPANTLDIGHQQQLMQALVNFSQSGVGVVMVVHDINLAARYAHQVLALYQGKAIAYGPTATTLNASLVKRLFNVEGFVMDHPRDAHKVFIL